MNDYEKYKIGFVVLHYKAITDTQNCINSVLKIASKEDVIIIVDNCSPDQSGQKLKDIYQGNNSIEIILNDENLGFAKGNNVGYVRAKNKYRCNIIILLNNDVLINQQDFRKILIKEYEHHRFDIVGPQILQKDGTINVSNPCIPIHTSIKRAKVGEVSNFIRYLLSFGGLDKRFGKMVDRKNIARNSLYNIYHEDVQLSGCFLIFTERYIKMFDGLNPNTFMYLEEIILYVRAKKANLVIAYDPKIQIIHLEDASTNAVFQENDKKKRQFKYMCQMKSFKVLLNELRGR